tara:strand:- start:59 stop:295 length:237 start_codon:yes stop_codon:yes gene_type:complete
LISERGVITVAVVTKRTERDRVIDLVRAILSRWNDVLYFDELLLAHSATEDPASLRRLFDRFLEHYTPSFTGGSSSYS